jgi:hypothetical protein
VLFLSFVAFAGTAQAQGRSHLAAAEMEGALCPPSSVRGGATLKAAFAGGSERSGTAAYGRRVLISGHVADAQGNAIAGASICIEERIGVFGLGYRLAGVATSNVDGDWFFKLHSGPSRSIRAVYSDGAASVATYLDLAVRAFAKLHLSRHRTPIDRPVYFSGRIPGPFAGGRVVLIRATVPGARRKYLVRRARTDAFGRFKATYAFTPISAPAKFVFWAVVPRQNGYPYVLGQSAGRYIRVSP